MDTKKIREGVSVKEIEGFAKKYRFEVFFCIALILAWFFSMVFFEGWSFPFIVLGGVLGLVWAVKIEGLLKKAFAFFSKQEDMTQLVLAGAGLILSVFLPFLLFFLLGLSGGLFLKKLTTPISIETKE